MRTDTARRRSVLSVPFGTFFGATLKVNLLFLLMIPLAWYLGMLGSFLTVFSLVLIHEMAHSAAAFFLGVRVDEIELLPFGGVARTSSELETMPAREIVVALAGPASNILLAMLSLLIDRYFPLPGEFLAGFISSNLLLAGFNMLPALPLDGGRVLRASLSFFCGLKTATRIASVLGIVLGGGVFALGVVSAFRGPVNITFLVCGLLLCLMARREGENATALFLRDATNRQRALAADGVLPVRQLAAPIDASVRDIVKSFTPRRYHVVTLIDEGYRECGVLREADLIRAMMAGRGGEPARDLFAESARR